MRQHDLVPAAFLGRVQSPVRSFVQFLRGIIVCKAGNAAAKSRMELYVAAVKYKGHEMFAHFIQNTRGIFSIRIHKNYRKFLTAHTPHNVDLAQTLLQ